MNRYWEKLPYVIEFLVNGCFIAHFTMAKMGSLPAWLRTPEVMEFFSHATWFAPLCVALSLWTHWSRSEGIEDFIRKYVFSLIIFIPLIMTWGDIEFAYWLSVVHLFSTSISLSDGPVDNPTSHRGNQRPLGWLHFLKLEPAQIVIISFALIILLGGLLLALPISTESGKSISFVDALFMATSATCVTGLATNSVVDDFSLFGQLILLALMQIGGLGIMTLSSSFAMMLGRSLNVREQVMMQDVLDSGSSAELMRLIVDIIKFTVAIEFTGAIILTIGFYLEDMEIGQSLYYGFFHAISAFCNAGLALFNNSLEDFAFSPLISGTIMVLIIMGGLGFYVIQDLLAGIRTKRLFVNYSLHTKIVVSTTAMLISFGAVYLFFGEFLHGFEKMTLWQTVQVSFFQSVTARTAGFNSVNLNSLHPHSLYMIVLLMFIGASPGGTGGGVKTSTFAILLQSVKATLKNSNRVEFFERTIPNIIVVRSIAIFIISLMVVSGMLLIMMRLEPDKGFLALFFETVSAFSTTGLSLGITSSLSPAGKVMMILMMYIGRVGPLTLVLAVGQRASGRHQITYPESKVMIG